MRENSKDEGVPGPLIRLADVPGLDGMPRRDVKPVGSAPAHRSPVSLATVHRWAASGLKGHKLRTVRAGGALVTTEAWIIEFFEALAGADGPAQPGTRTSRQ